MTEEQILAELMAVSPTFAADWCLTEAHCHPQADEPTRALYSVTTHLRGSRREGRASQARPLLAAVERTYPAAAPTSVRTSGGA